MPLKKDERTERGRNLDLVGQNSLGVELPKQLVSGKVKGRYDLLRVADQLGVEVRVRLMQVFAVDRQEWLLQHVDLLVRDPVVATVSPWQ